MTLVAVAPDPDPPPAIDPTVARARAGDRDAFAQLYHQHVDRVYARLTRLVGPVPERDGVPFAWPTDFEPLPTAAPQTWLMQGGWKRGGPPLSLWERPGPLT